MNMQFVNSRYNPRAKEINSQHTVSMLPSVRKNYYQTPVVKPQPVQVQAVPQNNPNKIRWGPPTWFLFHTLAHKIKDEHFSKIKTELLNNIIIICMNLPCPKCSEHATQYMKKINVNTISYILIFKKSKSFIKQLIKFYCKNNYLTIHLTIKYNKLYNV